MKYLYLILRTFFPKRKWETIHVEVTSFKEEGVTLPVSKVTVYTLREKYSGEIKFVKNNIY